MKEKVMPSRSRPGGRYDYWTSLSRYQTMETYAMLLLAGVAMLLTVVAVEVVDNEELDPFDMINFDHVNMKMRKKIPPTDEKLESTESRQESDKMSATSDPPEEQLPSDAKKNEKEEQRTELEVNNTSPQSCPAVSCPALSLFQQHVATFLYLIRDTVPQDKVDPTEMSVRLHLTYDQLEVLESFRKSPSEGTAFTAHEVLNEIIHGSHVLSPDHRSHFRAYIEDQIGVTMESVLRVVVILVLGVALLVVLMRLHFTFRLLMWMMFLVFVVSVTMTWYRLYKGEVAKQHEALMKDLPKGCSEVSEDDSTWQKLTNLCSSYFTFQKDACVEYYEHLIVDPIVKVSPMEAMAVAIVKTILKPMRTVGAEMSEFLRALLKDLPVQWQMVALILVLVLPVLTLFLVCGYRIRIPFVFALEPSHSDTTEVRALRERVSYLEQLVENNRAAGGNPNPSHVQPVQQAVPVAFLHPSGLATNVERALETSEDRTREESGDRQTSQATISNPNPSHVPPVQQATPVAVEHPGGLATSVERAVETSEDRTREESGDRQTSQGCVRDQQEPGIRVEDASSLAQQQAIEDVQPAEMELLKSEDNTQRATDEDWLEKTAVQCSDGCDSATTACIQSERDENGKIPSPEPQTPLPHQRPEARDSEYESVGSIDGGETLQ